MAGKSSQLKAKSLSKFTESLLVNSKSLPNWIGKLYPFILVNFLLRCFADANKKVYQRGKQTKSLQG